MDTCATSSPAWKVRMAMTRTPYPRMLAACGLGGAVTPAKPQAAPSGEIITYAAGPGVASGARSPAGENRRGTPPLPLESTASRVGRGHRRESSNRPVAAPVPRGRPPAGGASPHRGGSARAGRDRRLAPGASGQGAFGHEVPRRHGGGLPEVARGVRRQAAVAAGPARPAGEVENAPPPGRRPERPPPRGAAAGGRGPAALAPVPAPAARQGGEVRRRPG